MKKHNLFKYALSAFVLAGTLSACSSSDDDVVVPDIPPSDGTTMTLNGGAGAASAKNSVFVDFSNERQDSVARDSWNLGFYSGSQFHIILNSTTGSSAIRVDETDLNAVTEDDINLDDLAIPTTQPLGEPPVYTNVDDPLGDLNKTIIPEISATEGDNKVYVISLSGGSWDSTIDPANLYKIRVLRNNTGYTLQYAKLNDTQFQTVQVNKDDKYNFSYFSFLSGPVTVEPAKADWDIKWTWSMYLGGEGAGQYLYGFSDVVFLNNLGGVTAAEVLTESVSFEDFGESNLSGITFSDKVNVIGSTWRSTSPATGALKDRFYIVKDTAGNTYKLRFNSMGAGSGGSIPDGGVRGYPEIEFKLVKRG